MHAPQTQAIYKDILVSIYIPTHNRLELLDRAVRSVLQQSHENLEVIIVDDASEKPVLNIWGDSRVKIRRLEKPSGACVARNVALAECSGVFSTGLDDDDYFLPWRIAEFLQYWYSSIEPLRLHSNARIGGLFDETIAILKSKNVQLWNSPSIATVEALKRTNDVGNQIFAPTEHFLSSGLFDIEFPAWQDWELWLRIASKYGGFLNIHSRSYVADVSHSRQRISSRSFASLRKAKQLLCNKHSIHEPGNAACITLFLLSYPRSKVKLEDILILARAGRYRQAAVRLESFIRQTLLAAA